LHAHRADPGAARQRIQQEETAMPSLKDHHHHRHTRHAAPAQHLDKPGLEADMQQKPEFLAPDYCGSGKLAGMAA
jgi:hypothetical protein